MAGMFVTVLARRRAELRHGVRIAAAGMASFVLANALGLPQGYWAVFTAVLVVQGSVGGSWKAAVDRLIGTIFGAVYGAAVATLVPHNDTTSLGIALAISLTPLAILAALYPIYRVAPITAVILLLGSASASEPPYLAALLRTVEVSLGGVVGVAVSLFFLPARAHALLGQGANRVLKLLAGLLEDLLDGLLKPSDAGAIVAHHDAVRVALAALETVADEAARERQNYLTDDADPEPVTRTLRRVRHDLVLIGRVAAEPLPDADRARLSASLIALKRTGAEFMRALGAAFEARKPPPVIARFDAALAAVLAGIETEHDARSVALRFALEQLQRNVGDLTLRAAEFARTRKA